jgi:hypothetical protein
MKQRSLVVKGETQDQKRIEGGTSRRRRRRKTFLPQNLQADKTKLTQKTEQKIESFGIYDLKTISGHPLG